MSDEAAETPIGDNAVPTVRERLKAAHLSDERVHAHFEARAIVLDGVLVTDLDEAAPYGSRIVFAGR